MGMSYAGAKTQEEASYPFMEQRRPHPLQGLLSCMGWLRTRGDRLKGELEAEGTGAGTHQGNVQK